MAEPRSTHPRRSETRAATAETAGAMGPASAETGSTNDTGAMSETGGSLKQTARQAVEDVRHEATHLVDDARHSVMAAVEDQKAAAAGQVGGVARSLRNAAESLDEDQQWLSGYFRRAAESLDRISHTIEERDLGSLVRDIEGLARRQPALFIGGAVAMGFALARFARSTAPHSEPEPSYREQSRVYSGEPEIRDPLTRRDELGGTPDLTGTSYGMGGTTPASSPVSPSPTAIGPDQPVPPRRPGDIGGTI